MTTLPLISVIVPVYNGAALLRSMLDSILDQTDPRFELLLINDGSTDNGMTLDVINEYGSRDQRVRVICQPNMGAERTRDKGISLSRGKWVYVCDQDDFLHPRLFEFALWACERYDLDFLKISHSFGSIHSNKKLNQIVDFDDVKVDVIDNMISDASKIGRALKNLHTDCWSQFVKKELASPFSFVKYDLSRVFHIVTAAKRWGVENFPFYYYHGDIETSMIHQAVSPEWIEGLHMGLSRIYDLYHERARNEQGREIFMSICYGQIGVKLKIIFHMIKRLNKLNGVRRKIEVWDSFGRIVRDFLFVRRLPKGVIGYKHYVEYFFLVVFMGILRYFRMQSCNMRVATKVK